jgi:pimeloyl-ACP methyl ester carboxylesterase
MTSKPGFTRKRWLRGGIALGLVLLAVALWSGWAERYPQLERQLRVELQEQLEERLPAVMQPPPDRYGIFPQMAHGADGGTDGSIHRRPFRILLVHGLDEPGGIWADLRPALAAAGFDSWEFRYPNDQAIDRSTDLLASSWSELPADLPWVLIGHSMGGLVIRDFVSRWRHPVAATATPPRQLEGATVRGVILAGTPNQGSDWARLRVLLELRDQWAVGRDSGFSPLAGLQDGTGAAKIDLQPGSVFLADLNARPWPQAVQIHLIGGVLMASAPAMGDGVVTPDSLVLSGQSQPILLAASHRGMLARFFQTDDKPPAIPVIIALLEELESSQ